MRFLRLTAFVLVLAFAAPLTHASGAVGIYGVVKEVQFDPDARQPERVRVRGAFVVFDRWSNNQLRTAVPARGFLYFKLPADASQNEVARREWADLAAVAKTGEAVAFSSFGLPGGFGNDGTQTVHVAQPIPPGATAETLRQLVQSSTYTLQVWPEAAESSAPIPYAPSGGTGVVRLGKGNHDEIVATLRKLLAN